MKNYESCVVLKIQHGVHYGENRFTFEAVIIAYSMSAEIPSSGTEVLMRNFTYLCDAMQSKAIQYNVIKFDSLY
jgi:bifunctional pyridoxal-dependent enzyme with beta-cystathionase and maltose regulon repressor activities